MANPADEKVMEATPIEDVKASLNALQEAKQASAAEHNTTFKQAMRENWRAALWSAVISLTIVMEGYDMALMSNFFGYPTFQRKFGSYVSVPHDPGPFQKEKNRERDEKYIHTQLWCGCGCG